MAVSTSSLRRRASVNGILITLSILTGILAGLPILAGIMVGTFGGGSGPNTAFASAPAGQYAVYTNAGVDFDEIIVAPVANPAETISVATIERIPGFTSRGAVSPDGTKLALITVDGGTPSQPVASLLVLNLESGHVARLAASIDHLQTPLWTSDSLAVLFTRGGDNAPGAITLFRIDASGSSEAPVHSTADALGLYPVAYDAQGRLVTVLIDHRGSHVLRGGEELTTISNSITRDWALSPSGAELAFIETSFNDGARYLPRVVALDGSSTVRAQAMTLGGQALGVAWPGDGAAPAFGFEPESAPASGGVFAQSLAEGFDVPLGYSKDGSALFVQHWTGTGFASPGDVRFEIVTADGRVAIPDVSRFFGWSAR